ncbi:tetratricopeptide repeat protein [Pedobacter sp. PLR]|uniref:tetratricopeptide repeat protein n=1 Tax=Pedobacter sp. PLR TaxID=2994465 RepID=UPI002245F596|nr:tetratricopeptide repeat protein [Pedobacter sp. PLR]MCX2452720.1 tetratricopeptide repeat protein [Pedobacter sp. PLR]
MKMTKKAITLSLGLVVMGSASFAQSLNDAKKAVDAEQYQKATTMLKALVKSQANKGENYFNLGDLYLRMDYIDSARATFTQGVTADPKNPLNYIGLGEADLFAKNPTSAKTNFDKAVDVSSKKDYIPQLYIGKAYIASDNKDFTAALPYLQKADELDANDKDAETFLALGDYYAAQKKNSEALQNYMRALNINANLLRATTQIGRMYTESRAFPEAEEQLKAAITADPNYGPAYRELAELYMQWANQVAAEQVTKSAMALTNYKKYLDLTDNSYDSKLRYAQFLFYAKDFPGLEQVTTELATMNPNNEKALVVSRLRGYSAYENKNYPKSLEYMNDFFAKTKDTARIIAADYLYLGRAQMQAGNDSLALGNIVKAVEKDSTNVEALEEIGSSLFKAKNYEKAGNVFTLAVKANPNGKNTLQNYYYIGVAKYVDYAQKNQAGKNPDKKILADADSAFVNIIKAKNDFVLAYAYRARIAKYQDDLNNPKWLGVPYYEELIKLVTVTKPELAAAQPKELVEAYVYVGSYYAATDKEKAKEYLNKALAIDPQNSGAQERLKQLTAPAAKTPVKKK